MNRLALLAATSVVALCLTACGEHAAKKEETAPVATEAAKTEVAPAAEAEKAAPAAQEHAPSEAEAAGASAQE